MHIHCVVLDGVYYPKRRGNRGSRTVYIANESETRAFSINND